jgi:hypothetical protein
MENLAHSASFHSREKIAPSKSGIKHLASKKAIRDRVAAIARGGDYLPSLPKVE